MPTTPRLETERLILRPLAATDVPAIQRHIDNPNVVGGLSTAIPWPYPPDGARQWFDRQQEPIRQGRIHIWVLVDKQAGDQAIGVLELRVEPGDGGHRGFWLAEPWWGRGLMTEATQAMQDWAFFECGMPELIFCNAVDNTRSRRIKEKSGAEYLGEIGLESEQNRAEQWRLTAASWRAFRARSAGDHA